MHAVPVFIIGAQRSGTTLMRLMLNAHSQLAIPEEGTFWMPILRDFRRNGRMVIGAATLEKYLVYIRKNAQFRLWDLPEAQIAADLSDEDAVSYARLMSAYYETYARRQGKARWGDKSPTFFRMVPELSRLFPNAKFVHLIRDGRDNYLSWRKMGIQNRNISVGAVEWRHKVSRARKDLARFAPDRTLEVRYEDLVQDPTEALGRICMFLDLAFESEMSEFWKTSDRFIGRHHSETIFRPVTTDRIGRWRRMLSSSEIARFEGAAGKMLEEIGYPLTVPGGPTLRTVFRIGIDLLIGLPGRFIRVIRTTFVLNLSARLGVATEAAGAGEQTRKKVK